MKRHAGGATLIIVLLVMSGISMLLIRVHYRCSLLLETVIEREKQLKWHFAAQACMQYALKLAVSNWYYIHDTNKQGVDYITSWYVGQQEQVPLRLAFMAYESDLVVKIALSEGPHVREEISCKLKIVQEDREKRVVKKVMIYDWREGG